MTSTPEDCRKAYLTLARKLHPDVSEARSDQGSDSVAFQQLQEAYRLASAAASKNEASNSLHEGLTTYQDDARSEHGRKAPQHRRYLETNPDHSRLRIEVDGISPSERQKQIQTQRYVNAALASSDYRIARIQEEYDAREAESQNAVIQSGRTVVHKDSPLKSARFFERIADELIEEAMRRGDFNNLSGQGQPLPQRISHDDVFSDSSQSKLTKVLANQGFLPDWVQRGKEVREEWNTALKQLRQARQQAVNKNDPRLWKEAVKTFEKQVKDLNRSIDHYNLQVPSLQMQRCHLNASATIRQVTTEIKWKDAVNQT